MFELIFLIDILYQPFDVDNLSNRRFMPVKKRNIYSTKIAYHAYTWITIFVIYFVLVYFNSDKTIYKKLTASLSYVVFFAIIPTYIGYAVYNRFINGKKYIQYFLIIGLLIIFSGTVSYYYFKLFYDSPYNYVQWLGNAIFVVGLATAVKIVRQSFKERIQIHEIKAQQLESELALLKSQINPHFFFNTLNNLYALSLMKSEEVPAVILKLSELMRYILESSKKDSVDLVHEHEFLENYLYLQKIRFTSSQNIEYNVEGDLAGKRISPMLLMPFVENSFKHSTSVNVDQFRIRINLRISDNDLTFTAYNSKLQQAENQQTDSIKLGLDNVKRRLELLYPDQHVLEITDNPDNYYVMLRLQL